MRCRPAQSDCWICLWSNSRRLGLQEGDRDDRLAALVDEGLDVVGVVRRALRLAEVRRESGRAGILEALLGQVVEALVAETARVERDAGNRLGRRLRRRL